MKISENRRLRDEKKSMSVHHHRSDQASKQETKFQDLARAMATGDTAKLDVEKIQKILRTSGRSSEDLQKAVEDWRAKLKDNPDA